MQILVIGLGSMGNRRIRTLKNLGHTNITGYDTKKSRRDIYKQKYGILTFEKIEDALDNNPKAIIISTASMT